MLDVDFVLRIWNSVNEVKSLARNCNNFGAEEYAEACHSKVAIALAVGFY